jgi:transposase
VVYYSTGQILSTAYAAGAVHDFKLLKRTLRTLPRPVRILADKGYQGLQPLGVPCVLPTKGASARKEPELWRAIERVLRQRRVRVEPVFARLKRFRILASRYRNRRRRLGLRFNLIAGIYNFELTKIGES